MMIAKIDHVAHLLPLLIFGILAGIIFIAVIVHLWTSMTSDERRTIGVFWGAGLVIFLFLLWAVYG